MTLSRMQCMVCDMTIYYVYDMDGMVDDSKVSTVRHFRVIDGMM